VISRLRGPAETFVELHVIRQDETKSQMVAVQRQAQRVPSVTQINVLSDQPGIGYCQVLRFQKSTVQELDDALAQLRMQGMRALILDFRGNCGGYLPSAIQVAERFLPEGRVIVTTESHVPDQMRVYKSAYAGNLSIPLVILVDHDTASAAEVVAGALQAHRQATLVGQPTFGKWSVQRVLELKSAPAGIRVTLARFLSPGPQAYTASGIVPDVLAERSVISMADNQLLVAIQVALRLLEMRP
jgi:carboxyl-terminal processing protease